MGGSNLVIFRNFGVLCLTLCAASTKTNRRTTLTNDEWKERMNISSKDVRPNAEPKSSVVQDPISFDGTYANKRSQKPGIIRKYDGLP